MNKWFLATLLTVFFLAGCGGGGDINIAPVTTDNSNTEIEQAPVAVANPCASYENSGGQTIQGLADGANCTYSASFLLSLIHI